jgi:hypothetical protein
MASEWHQGVLIESSWHRLEKIGAMPDAAAMIAAGEASGAWPIEIETEELYTATHGCKAPKLGITAHYAGKRGSACLGVVGGRYTATTPSEWRDLVRAAAEAGGAPTGAFSLRDGSRVLATFEVGIGNGLRTNLVLVDSFDGTLKLTAGTTSIRVVCANTLAVAMNQDGRGMARLQHTSSLPEKVQVLAESVEKSIETGKAVRATYEKAAELRLHRDDAAAIFDRLFPAAAEDAPARLKTIAEGKRDEARAAMANPVNAEGPTLATLWNAATFLVDRRGDGAAREVRSGDKLDSLLFGDRGERVQEIQRAVLDELLA